jgi:hypothetical protein
MEIIIILSLIFLALVNSKSTIVHNSLARNLEQQQVSNLIASYYEEDEDNQTQRKRQNQQNIISYVNPNQQQQQQQYAYNNYQQQQQPPLINPLLKQAGTASIGLLFSLLIWRSFSAFEMADQFVSPLRLFALIPIIIISCANAFGFILNFMKPLNFKNHLKFILFLNIIREWVELIYNMIMLIITTSTSTIPRQTYFGRFFMNCWWSILCVSFSKSRWVLQVQIPNHLNQKYNYNNNNNNPYDQNNNRQF